MKKAVGEFTNHYIIDFVAFRFPVLYNTRPPDHKSLGSDGAKAPSRQINDAFAPDIVRLVIAPNPISQGFIQIITYLFY